MRPLLLVGPTTRRRKGRTTRTRRRLRRRTTTTRAGWACRRPSRGASRSGSVRDEEGWDAAGLDRFRARC